MFWRFGRTAPADVVIATSDDVQRAVQASLCNLQLTLPELREQARIGQFSSERARVVWSAIRDVVPAS